jgi:uncharacterized membrane protein YfhO
MGVPTLFAFLSCITAPKNQFSKFYLILTFLFLAMMTGTVLYYPFFKFFPGMDKMNPTRIIFLFVFAFSVTAGMGIHAMESLSKKKRNVYAGLAVTVFLLIVSLAIFSSNQAISSWFNQEYFSPWKPQMMSLLNRMIELRSLSSPVIYKPLIIASSAFGLFMLYVFLQNKKTKLVVLGLLLSVLAYDLISFGRAYNNAVEPQYIYPRTPALEFLMDQPRPFRVVQDTGNSLYVNTLAPFGLEEVGGYAGVYSDRINKLMSYSQAGEKVFEGTRYDRWVMFKRFSSKFFDLMNVRYVLTAPNKALRNPKYNLVFRKDLSVYENTQVMPRAYAVHKYTVKENLPEQLRYMGSDEFDMRNEVVLEKEPSAGFISGAETPSVLPEVTIDEYSPDKVTLTVDLSENGWLVLTDSFYTGWKAREQGEEIEILRANCNYRAVALEEGKHTVTFSYEPFSFYLGSILTVIGIVFAASGFIVSRFRRKK